MALTNRRKPRVKIEPYHMHSHVVVFDELPFGNDVIKPGDMIRIKNRRGQFKFYKVCHNMQKDVTWVDCMDVKTLEWRSFYIDEIKCVIRPKRSRRKKQGVIRN